MATKKRETKADEPKLNREQRRREKFGGHRVSEKEPWPTSRPNPALAAAGNEDEAKAGRPDQDQTKLTGPGTGGATEQEGRVPRHEGTHATNSTKG